MPTLLTTDNWILLTQPLGEGNKLQPPFWEAKLVARADGENIRHKGWCAALFYLPEGVED